MTSLPTVWVLGDQLNRRIGALAEHRPGSCRVLLVESDAKRRSRRWHRQRLHLVVSGMRHLAAELEEEGFDVDLRRAPTLADGLRDHVADHAPSAVHAMEPMSWDGRSLLERLAVETVANDQFLCSYDEFATWAAGRAHLRMEDFYRWQRARLDVLMDGDEPVGGRWNLDRENRERPPRDGRSWPSAARFPLDAIDEQVLHELGDDCWGAPPDGTWPVTREQALDRLHRFVDEGLDAFGPHEDAMLASEWKLAHSALSSSMNLGLLHPAEVVQAAVAAFERGGVRLNSVEGFVRQVIGWREYVWGVYWLWMPSYRRRNELAASRPIPPVLRGESGTAMACVAGVLEHLHDHGYTHHIERLMVLGNLALTAGVDPWSMTRWMWSSFVDGAEWVMLPNVIGMALHADGGQMATKPYAAGGAYIHRMSDYCGGCRYDPRKRTGDDACPFTTLYWDFLARHEPRFSRNHRLRRQLTGLGRLDDLADVRARARDVLVALDAGTL